MMSSGTKSIYKRLLSFVSSKCSLYMHMLFYCIYGLTRSMSFELSPPLIRYMLWSIGSMKHSKTNDILILLNTVNVNYISSDMLAIRG